MQRIRQNTAAHCGPAVLEMLTSYINFPIDQDEFVKILGIGKKIHTHGMTIKEMSLALKNLAPNLSFWYKNNSQLEDIKTLIKTHYYPVGIEWQGVFYEDSDGDDGHYSIVTHLDEENSIIHISDPYRRFAGTDRLFHINEFVGRWWDTNEITNEGRGTGQYFKDYHMIFIVTPADEIFPDSLGMKKSAD